MIRGKLIGLVLNKTHLVLYRIIQDEQRFVLFLADREMKPKISVVTQNVMQHCRSYRPFLTTTTQFHRNQKHGYVRNYHIHKPVGDNICITDSIVFKELSKHILINPSCF